MSSPITTHVLDTSTGQPAVGIAINLEKRDRGEWVEIGSGVTNNEGRVVDLATNLSLAAARYRLRFATKAYFEERKTEGFYPMVCVEFEVSDPAQHYHIPLLLSPYGYSTYRGS